MSSRTVTVCDNPHDDETAAEITRPIHIDGRRFEIDLCGPCAIKFELELTGLLKHARTVVPRRTAASRREDAAIRAWWAKNLNASPGPYQDKGRLPIEVVAAYNRTQGETK